MLADTALPLQPQLTDRCVLGLIKPDSWAGLPPAKAFRADADLAPLLRQADANEPGSLTYGVPVLMLQGTADTTVSPASTDLVRGELCASATALTYRAMPGATHNGMLPDTFGIVQPWIDARFAGAPAMTNCADAVKARAAEAARAKNDQIRSVASSAVDGATSRKIAAARGGGTLPGH